MNEKICFIQADDKGKNIYKNIVNKNAMNSTNDFWDVGKNKVSNQINIQPSPLLYFDFSCF